MGQKVNPIAFRLGVNRGWDSRWYEKGKVYSQNLHEDLLLRKTIKKKYEAAMISKVEIERAAQRVKVIIYTGRPGIIIGKKGAEIELFKDELVKLTGGKDVVVNIEEIKRASLDAQLVAEGVAGQLLRRIGFRRAMKKTVLSSMKDGAKGIKIRCAGRLGGAEIARSEWYREGQVPLHTLRANIDYGFAEATTKYGQIGIKVWIYKGVVLGKGIPAAKSGK